MSLRKKLILFTLITSIGSLALFAFVALHDFRRDKVAYVLDSNTQAAIHGAEIINLLLKSRLRALAPLVAQINQNTGITKATAKSFLSMHDLEAIALRKPGAPIAPNLEWSRDGRNEFRAKTPILTSTSVDIEQIPNSKDWRLTARLNGSSGYLLESIWNDNPFSFIENNTGVQDYFVVGPNSKVLIAPAHPQFFQHPNFSNISFARELGPFAVKTETLKINNEIWLIGISRLAFGNLFILAGTPRKVAFLATQKLELKTILFSVFLIFLIIAISIFSTGRITQTLSDLTAATIKISQGDFNLNIVPRERDEVGILASRFNAMAGEIKRLLAETAEKARMANELKTAKAVQEQLFPQGNLKTEEIEIEGFYESASECSGDWWFYQDFPEHVLFCVGDVTGHGAPAALMTSAARSAFATLTHIPSTTLPELMTYINEALYSMSKGATTMTFFLGKYRKADGVVEYCNASHHPAVYLPYKEDLKKKDLEFLDVPPGPAFASLPMAQYESGEHRLSPGDALFLYTDGILEMQNSDNVMFGERRLFKSLVSVGLKRHAIISTVVSDFREFRGGLTLQDDCTLLVVRRPALETQPLVQETTATAF